MPPAMTELEAFTVDLAREAARVSLPFFRSVFAQEDKGAGGAFDPVTEADRAAEAAIRRRIAARDRAQRRGGDDFRLLKGGTETPLRTRPCAGLDQALIATTDPDLFTPTERAAWTRLRAAARLARLGCDAYAYAMVAAGTIDLVAESDLKVWDWSALVPVIEAAGGRVTDWQGGAPNAGGQVLAVGDAGLLEPALSALGRAADV